MRARRARRVAALRATDGEVELEVRDDGVGFDAERDGGRQRHPRACASGRCWSARGSHAVAARGRHGGAAARARSRGARPCRRAVLLADDHARRPPRACARSSTTQPTSRSSPRPATAPRRSRLALAASARPRGPRRLDAEADRPAGGAPASSSTGPSMRVLILSMHDNEEFFFEALRAGAVGLRPEVRGRERPRRRVPRGAARRAVPLPARAADALRARLPRARPDERGARGPADPARDRGRQAHRRGPHEPGDRRAAVISEKTVERHRATCSRSSGCATASRSRATPSAAGSSSPEGGAGLIGLGGPHWRVCGGARPTSNV